MALFKPRRGAEEPAAAPASPEESIEALRRRARHRLIGAVVLVVAGVIGFPLLFDTQPRPVAVDIPIEIPDRNKVKPLPPLPSSAPVAAGKVAAAPPPASTPAPKADSTSAAPAVVAAAEKPAVADKPASRPEAAPKPEPKVAKAEPAPRAEPEPKKAAPEPAAKSDDGARARALLEGNAPAETTHAAAAAESGRFVVQVGAFSDEAKAREVRQKVERAGLKTYTHVAETKEGKLIRVRTGPYASRAEADKAAEKIKGLDLQARILTL